MAASTTSAPIPVKTSRHPLPYWQITDNASARASDGRRVAAMSVGDRSVAASTDYRDISDKTYTYSNENVRKEFSLKDGPKYFGRKAARKTEEQASPSDDESMSESSSESSNSDEDWETVPESDKESESAKPDTPEDDSSDSSVEIIDMRPFKPPVIELLDDTPPASPVQTPRLSAPPEDIIAAIESLSLSVACMQESRRLPFLRRNLQRGFLKYCRARRVPTESDGQAPSIAVIFKLADSELPPHEASMSCYECPLCRLHSPFRTKAMLEIHLDRDHREVRTNWEEIDDKMHWRLELLFTSTGEDGEIPEFELITPEPRTSTPPESVVEPPPNPFGPTAKFPFLPAKSEYGGPDLEYSVRFSGPKIYDLLGTLPMEPYGILAWAVLDREEEIFESDDMPDEHKVMHALWARWIALRRCGFLAVSNEQILIIFAGTCSLHIFSMAPGCLWMNTGR
ncbi:hypothetical protein FB451DRAFT_220916 [Mycena latifolia]|nr:hypothetical protein FB451DRAFT_220916 [Mycena latifolia]